MATVDRCLMKMLLVFRGLLSSTEDLPVFGELDSASSEEDVWSFEDAFRSELLNYYYLAGES